MRAGAVADSAACSDNDGRINEPRFAGETYDRAYGEKNRGEDVISFGSGTDEVSGKADEDKEQAGDVDLPFEIETHQSEKTAVRCIDFAAPDAENRLITPDGFDTDAV